ncbi:transporter substrate-binding domain-containing protein, partial [Kaarinaea lacus]
MKTTDVLSSKSSSSVGFWFRWLLIATAVLLAVPQVHSAETDDFIQKWQIDSRWTGDFDGMAEHRIIRVLVVHNKMMFFFDKATIRGVTHDAFREFEKYINKKLKTGTRKIKVVFLPVPRDKLLPWLVEGRGDIAAANLTITPERQKLVDFTRPVLSNVNEILISGPAAPAVKNIDSLSGKEIHVRASSSYFEHLTQLNNQFKKQGKPLIKIVETSEYLEDSDLLEMVNVGLIPMVVVDEHKAKFWAQIFDKIKIHSDIAINTGGKIAWSIRKDSPKLKEILDGFLKKHKKGTLLGNMLFNRYLRKNKWARNSLSPKEQKKFQKLEALFQKYSDQYEFDYLMMAA